MSLVHKEGLLSVSSDKRPSLAVLGRILVAKNLGNNKYNKVIIKIQMVVCILTCSFILLLVTSTVSVNKSNNLHLSNDHTK